MPAHTPRRLLAALAVAAAGAVTVPAAASAAPAIATAPCPTFLPGTHGAYVGVAGAGFTPSSSASFSYGAGSAGALPTDTLGRFRGLIAGPKSIANGGHVKRYAIKATDAANPFLTASANLKVVRFDAVVPAKHPKPRAKITFRLYGFPRKTAVWAHYVLHGKVQRTLRFGTPKGACGLLHKRVRTLPTRVRFGIWHIYLTNHRRFPHSHRARVRQSLSSFTYKHVVVSARASAASGPGEDTFRG
jgi:hypothetical protein